MRELLFRGKRWDNGEWVCGDLRHGGYYENDIAVYIMRPFAGTFENFPVYPATVGQYTGLTDKNGKKIFEGDIVRGKDALIPEMNIFGYISHENGSFVIIGNIMHHYRWLDYDVDVIGNIHDNPELLEDYE